MNKIFISLAFATSAAQAEKISRALFLRDENRSIASEAQPEYPSPETKTIVKEHLVINIDDGHEALAQRLRMIERAEKTIDLSTWDLATDQSGRLVYQALMAKAKANPSMKIRILVDGTQELGNMSLFPALADEITQNSQIEVRYYNHLPLEKQPLLPHHMHAKYLVIDNVEVILGGRNTGDDYFDFKAGEYGFHDREVWIKGPVSEVATQAFENFWHNRMSQTAAQTFPERMYRTETLKQSAHDVFVVNKGDKWNYDRIVAETPIESRIARSPKVTFFVDPAGAPMLTKRIARNGVVAAYKLATKELVIENYDYSPSADINAVISKLIKSGGDVTVVSNSYVTESDAMANHLNLNGMQGAATMGAKVYAFDGRPSVVPSWDKPKWYGLHAKSAIMDNRDVLYSSYNLDTLSAQSNAESGVVIYDVPEIAAQVRASIEEHKQNSWLVDSHARYHQYGLSPEPPEPLKGTLFDELAKAYKKRTTPTTQPLTWETPDPGAFGPATQPTTQPTTLPTTLPTTQPTTRPSN